MRKITFTNYITYTKGKAIAIVLFMMVSVGAQSQVFWQESFGTGACLQGQSAAAYMGSNGAWTIGSPGTNNAQANAWFVSSTEAGMGVGNCGDGCLDVGNSGLNNQTLHIGANDGFVLDEGASYDAGGMCGLGICVLTDTRAQSPTINCTGHTNITLSFNYMLHGTAASDFMTVEYSINNGTSWTLLSTPAITSFGTCSPQGLWTAYSVALPVACNNVASVKIGFRWKNNDDGVGTDPSVAIDDITLATPSANSITLGAIVGGPFCACSTINVPFTISGVFNAGNTFTAQVSDGTGSFAVPTSTSMIGGTSSGTISLTLPCFSATSSGFLIQIVSTNPALISNISPPITITNSSAAFTFIPPYCQNDFNPFPIFIGAGTAGVFTSSPAGLVFANSSTGEVNLAASATGTNFTVTNTVAATGGCPQVTATSNISITVAQNSNFSYSSSAYCTGAGNQTPTITGVAGGSFSATPAGLSINAATGVINLAASSAGTYSITYSLFTGTCPSSTSVNVTITGSAVSTFNYSGSPYCSTAANPSPTFTGGGIAGNFTATPVGLVFVNAATGVVNIGASTPGTYTVTNTVAASGGCLGSSSTATFVISALANAGFNYSAAAYCQSGTNPLPTVTGVAGGTFTSTPAGLSINSSSGLINLVGSTLNTYTVTYTTSGACSSSSSVTVGITTAPVGTFNYAGTPYCSSATNPLPTFTGGGIAGTFSSTPGLVFVNTATGEVNLLASTAGTYTVTNTIAASGACSASTSTSTIVINAAQDASFSFASPSYCQAGTNPSPNITGTAGGTFTATPAGLVFSNATTGLINIAASTINSYVITYTTAGPCAATSSASLDVVNSPIASFSYTGNPYCTDGSDPSPTYSVGGVAGTFSSTTGLVFVGGGAAGQVDLSASTPGSYTVTNFIAALGGCPSVTATSIIDINVAEDSSFSYSANDYCQSGTNPIPTITGTPGGTFSSTPGLVFVSASTGEINLAASTAGGPYNITYTTPGPNCISTMTVAVTISAAPVATFSYPSYAYCQNGTNPSPTYSGGGTAGNYSASPAGLTFVSTTTGVVNLLTSIPGTYVITNNVTSTGVCPPATDTTTIVIDAASTGAFSYTGSPYCQNGTNPVPAFTLGSVAGTFTSTPLGLSIIATTGAVNLGLSTANTYTVTNTIGASGACPVVVNTATIQIVASPVATFSYTPMSYCQNATNPSPVFSGGGTAGSFTSTVGLSINGSTGVVSLLSSSQGTYLVTNTIAATASCAAVTDTSTIIIHSNPIVTINSPAICQGQAATLTAAGAISYTWSAGATSTGTSTATASPAVTTTYTITGIGAGGCTGSALSTVTVNNCNIVPNFVADDTVLCQSGCVTFTDLSTGNPTNWQWVFQDGTPSTSTSSGPINVCYSTLGSHFVTLIVSNSTSTDTLTRNFYIDVVEPIPVTITGITTINSCESTELTAMPAGTAYLWGPNDAVNCNTCQTATMSPTVTQPYYVTYTDINGCTDSDTTIVVVTDVYTYYMPTGLSPNGDGNNDVLYVHGRGIDYFDLKIFDRVGEKVFETTSFDSGWDGTWHGLGMNDNSFTYALSVTYCTGQTVKENGTLTVVR